MTAIEFTRWVFEPVHVLALLTLLLSLFTAYSVLQTINLLKIKLGIKEAPKPASARRFWFNWNTENKALWASVPVEQERDIMLDHDYDGIKELDNKLPPWWVWGFYVTIAWGIGYLGYFHVMSGPRQVDEFKTELAEKAAIKEAYLATNAMSVDENSVTLLTDEAALSAGRKIFIDNCASCHAADGGGLVGPNFTDQYWIHGGGIADVFGVIKYGVLEKGMISWQETLNPVQMQQVASYVLSLQGTAPAAPKEPQGNLWTAPDATPADTAAAALATPTAE
ncbi:MAG: cbb3-type cytochrome c oxidase N-terminal domain-containing protein [Bacteroidota bacterium]